MVVELSVQLSSEGKRQVYVCGECGVLLEWNRNISLIINLI